MILNELFRRQGQFRANASEEAKMSKETLMDFKERTVPDWEMLDHRILKADYVAKNHRQAIKLVEFINRISEYLDHFAEVTQDVSEVTVKTTTSDTNSLTILDFALAKAIDEYANKNNIEQQRIEGNFEAAGVGIVTKQNATGDVPVGGEYQNVKKMFPTRRKKKTDENFADGKKKNEEFSDERRLKMYNPDSTHYLKKLMPKTSSSDITQKSTKTDQPDDSYELDTKDFDKKTIRKVLPQLIDDMLDNEKNKMVIKARFGLKPFDKSYTLKQIGDWLGVTQEVVRQREAKALRQLRHPSRSEKLRDLIDSQYNENFADGKKKGKKKNENSEIGIHRSSHDFAVIDLSKSADGTFWMNGVDNTDWDNTVTTGKGVDMAFEISPQAKLASYDDIDRYSTGELENMGYDGVRMQDGNNVAYQIWNTDILTRTELGENFADGKKKGKSRPGRVKRAGASCDGSVTSLRKKAKNASGEKQKMYHWCANMKSGRQKS